MKKSLFSLLCFLIMPFCLQAETPTKLFSGTIEFPHQLLYDLCLFYKGQKLEIEQNQTSSIVHFSFLDSKETQIIYFIIVNSLTCVTEKDNTLHALKIPKAATYKCYKLQAKREILDDLDDEHQLLTWTVQQHELSDNLIPHNSLIFLFDPTLIEGLKAQYWKPENLFRIIPTLLIKNSSKQEINDAMLVARLASMDVAALHCKPTSQPIPQTSNPLTSIRSAN